jgi:predicted DNA-binding ribbon-helix-helix protein
MLSRPGQAHFRERGNRLADGSSENGSSGRAAVKSSIIKRSIIVAGHKTSVSLEDAFWKGLKEIAVGRDMTLSDLVAAIDSERRHGNLSSAIRLFVLDFYRSQLSQPIGDPTSGEADGLRRRY